MPSNRKQINLRVDDELLEAIGELQRGDAGVIVPSQTAVIRKAVLEARDRLREQSKRAKKR